MHYEIYKSADRAIARDQLHSGLLPVQPPSMNEAINEVMRLVEIDEKFHNVRRDAFMYEHSRLPHGAIVYAPTHPNWRHLPAYYIFERN
jgi:hypothetical protein